jgi:glutathione peroxidase
MTSKYDVKGDNAHPIYYWAKDTYGKSQFLNGIFIKFLINKNGKVEGHICFFHRTIIKQIIKKLEEIL